MLDHSGHENLMCMLPNPNATVPGREGFPDLLPHTNLRCLLRQGLYPGTISMFPRWTLHSCAPPDAIMQDLMV